MVYEILNNREVIPKETTSMVEVWRGDVTIMCYR